MVSGRRERRLSERWRSWRLTREEKLRGRNMSWFSETSTNFRLRRDPISCGQDKQRLCVSRWCDLNTPLCSLVIIIILYTHTMALSQNTLTTYNIQTVYTFSPSITLWNT